MKFAKIVIILLVCLFIFSAFAIADETNDFSNYTIEELLTLRASIQDEITSRMSGTATLQPGKYVAGVDITAGSYILVGLVDESPDGYTPQALYAESMEKAGKWDYIDREYIEEGVSWRFTLQDGMVLEIRYANMEIQQAAPILFAP